jgi:UDP-3-O-[3-hydroxymyristoyl] N-acetylglucosamine deacetylase/3-hydroxyacyl-[acyl-carrier-protein] dehydratase
VVFKLDLITPIRQGIVHMMGNGYVNGQPAVQGELMALVSRVESPEKKKEVRAATTPA